MRAHKPVIRFVRAVLAAGRAERVGDGFRVAIASGEVRIPADAVRQLQSDGVLGGDKTSVTALPGTIQWLKRQLLETDSLADQHRDVASGPDGTRLNLGESPLLRLASPSGGQPAFLERHQIEAGERVRRLVDRAHLQPRTTMNYSDTPSQGGGRSGAGDIGDMAADARKALADLYTRLPRDCADVVFDVCGSEKGLQQVEAERGWPRRSAKLVLRIGLDQLARLWGIGSVAVGRGKGTRAWSNGERMVLGLPEAGPGAADEALD